MAGEASEGEWPRPKFHFSVDIEGVGTDLQFQEVTGLDTEAQPIEYRSGDSRNFSPAKLPGLRKSGNVTMKRGIFAKDNHFWEWYGKLKANRIERANVTIRLLDEGGNQTMAWTLTNAWPAKITGPALNAAGNEVAVESIELAHEGLTIANG